VGSNPTGNTDASLEKRKLTYLALSYNEYGARCVVARRVCEFACACVRVCVCVCVCVGS